MWRLHILLHWAWNGSNFLKSLGPGQSWIDKEETSYLIVNPQNPTVVFLISTTKKSVAMDRLFLILTCLWGSVPVKNSEVLSATLVYIFCSCLEVLSVNVGPAAVKAAVYFSTEYGEELLRGANSPGWNHLQYKLKGHQPVKIFTALIFQDIVHSRINSRSIQSLHSS